MLVAICAVARAQTAADQVRADLRVAVRQDDRARVVSLIDFPVTVRIGGVRLPFSTPAALLAQYTDIFTPEMRDAIERGDAKAVRLSPIRGTVRITELEVPDRVERVESSGIARPGTPGAVRRIGVRAGPRPTQLSGALGTSPDSYLLFIPKGSFVEVRLERVGRSAKVRVEHAETRVPLNARMSTGALVVSGRAAADGDYRIEVERSGAADSDHVPYILSVTMR